MDGLTQLTAKTEEKTQQSQPDGVKRMTMVSAEGGRYTGETNMEGKRQGRGEYIWPNNDRYMGDFADGVKNDKLHGPATYYYSVGRIDEEVWEMTTRCQREG